MTMLLTTATLLPGVTYRALGIVIGEDNSVAKSPDPAKTLEALEKVAKKLGADAVIGIQFVTMGRPTIGGHQNLLWAIGTAIKF